MKDEVTRVFLCFRAGASAYAVPIERVQEVIERRDLTRVPSMPAAIRGLMNLRGTVVPVIDLMRRFDLGESAMASETCVIVCQLEEDGRPSLMAVLSDSSAVVVTLPRDDVHPPPTFGAEIDIEYLDGMIRIDEAFVLLLNIDRVLSSDDLLRTRELLVDAASQSVAPSLPGPR